MAERRMFAKSIIDSDKFLEMPMTSQLLYFHLSMRADDDGFIDKPKSIMRLIGCKDDDIKVLIANSFVIPFDTGIVVVKHWRVHNYIQKDRYRPTQYQDEKELLKLEKSGVYTMDTECIHPVSSLDTQVRIGKDRIGKDSIELEEGEQAKTPSLSKPIRHKYGEYHNVLLTDDELEKLKSEIPDYIEYIERLSAYMASTGKSYKNHLATIRNWKRKDLAKNGHQGDTQNITGQRDTSKYGITL